MLHAYVPPLVTSSIILSLLTLFKFTKFSSKAFQSLFILCIFTFMWHFSWVFLFIQTEINIYIDIIVKVSFTFILYLPVAWIKTLHDIYDFDFKYKYYLSTYLSLLSLSLFTNLIIDGVSKFSFGFYPKAGILFSLFVIFIVFCSIKSVLVICKGMNKDPYYKKISHFLLASLSVYFLSAYDILLNFELVRTYPYGFICSIVFILIISYTVINLDLASTTKIIETTKTINRSLEAELINKEKLSSIGLVSAGIAHQLGNTLNVISTASILHQRLEKKGRLTKEISTECWDDIAEAVDLSKEIISSINSLSQENNIMKPNNLRELVVAATTVAKGKSYESVEYINDISSDIEIFCSRSSMIQVFMNLYLNAVDALPESGGYIKTYLEEGVDYFNIHIEDNGSGIDELIKDNIFDEFITSKDENSGTGLGLYIARKEVQKNKAKISFSSSKEGTVFLINFPKEHT